MDERWKMDERRKMDERPGSLPWEGGRTDAGRSHTRFNPFARTDARVRPDALLPLPRPVRGLAIAFLSTPARPLRTGPDAAPAARLCPCFLATPTAPTRVP